MKVPQIRKETHITLFCRLLLLLKVRVGEFGCWVVAVGETGTNKSFSRCPKKGFFFEPKKNVGKELKVKS